jgi:hypothetical protein
MPKPKSVNAGAYTLSPTERMERMLDAFRGDSAGSVEILVVAANPADTLLTAEVFKAARIDQWASLHPERRGAPVCGLTRQMCCPRPGPPFLCLSRRTSRTERFNCHQSAAGADEHSDSGSRLGRCRVHQGRVRPAQQLFHSEAERDGSNSSIHRDLLPVRDSRQFAVLVRPVNVA